MFKVYKVLDLKPVIDTGNNVSILRNWGRIFSVNKYNKQNDINQLNVNQGIENDLFTVQSNDKPIAWNIDT